MSCRLLFVFLLGQFVQWSINPVLDFEILNIINKTIGRAFFDIGVLRKNLKENAKFKSGFSLNSIRF